jgi:hypothetical protein
MVKKVYAQAQAQNCVAGLLAFRSHPTKQKEDKKKKSNFPLENHSMIKTRKNKALTFEKTLFLLMKSKRNSDWPFTVYCRSKHSLESSTKVAVTRRTKKQLVLSFRKPARPKKKKKKNHLKAII